MVLGDTLDEPDETFNVDLTNAAKITDAQGVGTILDNDAAAVLSIGNASVTEGNPGRPTRCLP